MCKAKGYPNRRCIWVFRCIHCVSNKPRDFDPVIRYLRVLPARTSQRGQSVPLVMHFPTSRARRLISSSLEDPLNSQQARANVRAVRPRSLQTGWKGVVISLRVLSLIVDLLSSRLLRPQQHPDGGSDRPNRAPDFNVASSEPGIGTSSFFPDDM